MAKEITFAQKRQNSLNALDVLQKIFKEFCEDFQLKKLNDFSHDEYEYFIQANCIYNICSNLEVIRLLIDRKKIVEAEVVARSLVENTVNFLFFLKSSNSANLAEKYVLHGLHYDLYISQRFNKPKIRKELIKNFGLPLVNRIETLFPTEKKNPNWSGYNFSDMVREVEPEKSDYLLDLYYAKYSKVSHGSSLTFAVEEFPILMPVIFLAGQVIRARDKKEKYAKSLLDMYKKLDKVFLG